MHFDIHLLELLHSYYNQSTSIDCFLKQFAIGSQLIQPSMAQDSSQMREQVKEKIGGAVGQYTDGNQTGNQSGGVLGQLGNQAKSMLGQ